MSNMGARVSGAMTWGPKVRIFESDLGLGQ